MSLLQLLGLPENLGVLWIRDIALMSASVCMWLPSRFVCASKSPSPVS